MKELKLTQQEKEAVIDEIAERLKDVVYMRARDRAEEILELLLEDEMKEYLKPTTPIEINYKIQFLWADILQIIGRLRRTSDADES